MPFLRSQGKVSDKCLNDYPTKNNIKAKTAKHLLEDKDTQSKATNAVELTKDELLEYELPLDSQLDIEPSTSGLNANANKIQCEVQIEQTIESALEQVNNSDLQQTSQCELEKTNECEVVVPETESERRLRRGRELEYFLFGTPHQSPNKSEIAEKK